MPDSKQLPYLIKLLDDDSPTVQKALARELASYGPALREELARLPAGIDPARRNLLFELLEHYQREQLEQEWAFWKEEAADKDRLEKAFVLLSRFQSGPFGENRLQELLDGLAAEYRSEHRRSDAYELARFLFSRKGLRGAGEEDYYNPQNSNLVYVIEEKRGIPISLSAVYMLTGRRLGLEIEGCNYPGHFLARTSWTGKLYLVDCFHGGRFIGEDDLVEYNADAREAAREVVHETVNAGAMMRRVLRNLVNAYEKQGQEENSRLMERLIAFLDAASAGEE